MSYRLQYALNVTQLLDALLVDYKKGIRPNLEGRKLFSMSIDKIIVHSVKYELDRRVPRMVIATAYCSFISEGFSTHVYIDMAVRSMGPISEVDMCYSMDCYFRQQWKDDRLKYHSDTEEALSLGASMLDKIWIPDTYFWNGQDSYLHKLTVPNRFIRLKQDGTVHYSSRLTIKAKCPMYLHNFPLDSQKCPLFIGSFAYQAKDVVYIWRKGINNSVTSNPDLELSQYVLRSIAMGFANLTREAKEGEFSILTVHFHLDRHIGYFLINFYVPCTMIVLLSWVAFWINREATADRIGLGATSILTMTFMALDSKQDLPKVTYATALDVYMVLCYAFVLGTIAEFSLVHSFTKYNTGDVELRYLEKDRVEEFKKIAGDIPPKTFEKNGGIYAIRTPIIETSLTNLHRTKIDEKEPLPTTSPKGERNPNMFKKMFTNWADCGKKVDAADFDVNSTSSIDRVARMLFPSCFTFCSVVYWYTYWRKQ